MLCGYETICYEIETTLMSTHTVQHITENLRFILKNLTFLNVWKTIRIICFVQLMLWKLSSHALCLRNHAHVHFYIVCLQCWQARFLMKQHKCVNAWQSHYKDVFVLTRQNVPVSNKWNKIFRHSPNGKIHAITAWFRTLTVETRRKLSAMTPLRSWHSLACRYRVSLACRLA